jgi:[ribosomal protein S18]-alanine N-acetyltransferase
MRTSKPETLKIRSATTADIPVLVNLERHAVTAAHWSEAQYQAAILSTEPARMALVIEEQGSVQGFLIARSIDREWEIENIAIAGQARRRGLGTRLVGEFLDAVRAQSAEAVLLEVRESNVAARRLYEKWAFIESGRRKHYYREPEDDAILYRFEFP